MLYTGSGGSGVRHHPHAVAVFALLGAGAAVCEDQLQRCPSGLLFPNRWGGVFSPDSVSKRMIYLARECGHHVTAYQLRHTFATRALAAGVPDAHVAALLGHVDANMVNRHYGHLGAMSKVLRDAAEKASRQAG